MSNASRTSRHTVAVTGIGVVTPLGHDLDSTWNALLAGRSIDDHFRLPDEPADLCDGFPRISRIAIQAAREALGGCNATALVFGTSKGPIEQWLAAKPSFGYGLAETAVHVAAAAQLPGPRLTLSAACASGLCALIRGALLIAAGEADRVLVVAAEASVHPLFLASFRRLGVLPPAGLGCRPFDLTRQGFLMSEAAAAVLLEACPSPAPGQVLIDRFAMGADGTHLTSSDPDSAAMASVLRRVLGGPVDLIHAHGTGTLMNDQTELDAIERVLPEGGPKPLIYSHKGAMGHSLGAAGLVSVVINVMCHRHGIVPPNVRTTQPIAMDRVALSNLPVHRAVRTSIASAAGFGGPIAAVGLRSVENSTSS